MAGYYFGEESYIKSTVYQASGGSVSAVNISQIGYGRKGNKRKSKRCEYALGLIAAAQKSISQLGEKFGVFIINQAYYQAGNRKNKREQGREGLRKGVVLLGFHKITAAERCQNFLPPLS